MPRTKVDYLEWIKHLIKELRLTADELERSIHLNKSAEDLLDDLRRRRKVEDNFFLNTSRKLKLAIREQGTVSQDDDGASED